MECFAVPAAGGYYALEIPAQWTEQPPQSSAGDPASPYQDAVWRADANGPGDSGDSILL